MQTEMKNNQDWQSYIKHNVLKLKNCKETKKSLHTDQEINPTKNVIIVNAWVPVLLRFNHQLVTC